MLQKLLRVMMQLNLIVCKNCEFFGKRCTGGCPLFEFEIGPFAPKPKEKDLKKFEEKSTFISVESLLH